MSETTQTVHHRYRYLGVSGIGLGVFWGIWGVYGFWWGLLYGLFWPVWFGYRAALYLSTVI